MKNIQLILEYIGTNYNGYQTQKNGKSIQSELDNAIEKALGEKTNTYASGRTDAGVHAKGQVVNFLTDTTIPPEKIAIKINQFLPKDISIVESREVQRDFNARFWAVAKEYRYRICLNEHFSVFESGKAFHFPYKLDIDRMNEACTKLLGEHDFSSFQASRNTLKTDDTKRKIIMAAFEEKKHGILVFKIRGTGFLYNMVRILVGTLLDIGTGKKDISILDELFKGDRRSLAGKTVPPDGLYLYRVFYNNGEAKSMDKNSAQYKRAELYYKHTVEHTIFKKARGIIMDGDNIVAICEIKKGTKIYFITGGGVEPNETPEQAVVREAKEEINADIEVVKLLYVLKERFKRQMFDFKVDCDRYTYYYLCKLKGGDLCINAVDEFDGDNLQVVKLPKSDVNKLLVPKPLKKAFFKLDKGEDKSGSKKYKFFNKK